MGPIESVLAYVLRGLGGVFPLAPTEPAPDSLALVGDVAASRGRIRSAKMACAHLAAKDIDWGGEGLVLQFPDGGGAVSTSDSSQPAGLKLANSADHRVRTGDLGRVPGSCTVGDCWSYC